MTQDSFFDDDDGGKFEILPEGVYWTTLTDVTLDERKEGNPKISIELTLKENNRKAWLNLGFGEKQKKFSGWQFRELHVYDRAKALTTEKHPKERAFLDALTEIMGSKIQIDLTHREWNGKILPNIVVLQCELPTTTTAQQAPVGGGASHLKNEAPKAKANDNAELPF